MKNMSRSVSVAVLIAVGILSAGALRIGSKDFSAAAAQQKPAAPEVKIDNFSFGPATLTVPAGTTVTWTNRDDIPHTVTSSDDPRLFKSKVLDTDEKFSFTFTKAGTYPYFCSIHPKMTAKVLVQ
jgi:plastocyanin